MKQKNKVILTLVLCVLLVSSFTMTGSSVKKNIDDWETIIDVNESGGSYDYIKFGEKSDASNGIDQYDVPKPPTPPGEFIRMWINAQHLPYPYSIAWYEYRSLPQHATTWEIKVLWIPQDGFSTNAIFVWDSRSFGYYKRVMLFDDGGNPIVDMKKDNSYSFQIEPYGVVSFEVQCSTTILHLLQDDS